MLPGEDGGKNRLTASEGVPAALRWVLLSEKEREKRTKRERAQNLTIRSQRLNLRR